MTIMLEVGDISRFARVGDFSSYCRCVPTGRLSNGKNKGKGNVKNGNRYLAWAFTEAAYLSMRQSSKIAGYYNRILQEEGFENSQDGSGQDHSEQASQGLLLHPQGWG